MSVNPGKIGKTGKKLKGFNDRDNIIKGESKDGDPDRTVPYNTYNTLKEQYYTALKDAEHYKRLWETAYTDPEKIKLWSCIKHKLFGFSNGYNMFRGLFGHFCRRISPSINSTHSEPHFIQNIFRPLIALIICNFYLFSQMFQNFFQLNNKIFPNTDIKKCISLIIGFIVCLSDKQIDLCTVFQ